MRRWEIRSCGGARTCAIRATASAHLASTITGEQREVLWGQYEARSRINGTAGYGWPGGQPQGVDAPNTPDRQTALHATVGFVVISVRRAVYMVPPRVMAKYALGRVNNLIGSGKVIAGRGTRIHRRYPSFSRCRQNERTARVRMRGHCDRRRRYLRHGTARRRDVHLGRLSHSVRRRRIVDR